MKIRSFDPIAPFYDVFMALFRKHIPGRIIAGLKPGQGDVVLDVGGGTGYNAARMEGEGRRVIVVDISFKMLKRARKAGGLDLVLGDARMLPFKEKRFDVVMAVDSLHHVKDYPAVLKEVRRTGRGKVFVAEFWGRSLAGKVLTGLERLFLPVAYLSPNAFRAEASRQGIGGGWRYVSGYEYFFLGRIEEALPVPEANAQRGPKDRVL